jgi:hypothetical protein
MVTFSRDNRLKSLLEEEPTSEEELDTWDWVPVNLIVEARRLNGGVTSMVCGIVGPPTLSCHVFGSNLY